MERVHGPIVKALVKVCHGKIGDWPRLLPFALWANRTTHSTVTRYMPTELIFGQKPIMPVEQSIVSWSALPWQDEISREDLLALRIWQLESAPNVYSDSQSVVALSKNPVHHNASKHIEVRYHFVRDCVISGKIGLEKISTTDNVADGMTKCLSADHFRSVRQQMDVMTYRSG